MEDTCGVGGFFASRGTSLRKNEIHATVDEKNQTSKLHVP